MAHQLMRTNGGDNATVKAEEDLRSTDSDINGGDDDIFEYEFDGLEHRRRRFTPFPKLPKELRLEIWELAVPEPRIIRLGVVSTFDEDRNITGAGWGERDHEFPAELLRACQESAEVTNRFYSSIQPQNPHIELLGCEAFESETCWHKNTFIYATRVDHEKDIVIVLAEDLRDQLRLGGLTPNLSKIKHLAIVSSTELAIDPEALVQLFTFVRAATSELRELTLLLSIHLHNDFFLYHNLQSRVKFLEINEKFEDMEFECNYSSRYKKHVKVKKARVGISNLSWSAALLKQDIKTFIEHDEETEFWQKINVEISTIAYPQSGESWKFAETFQRPILWCTLDGVRYPEGCLYLQDLKIFTPCDKDLCPDHKYIGLQRLFEEAG